MAFSDKSVVMYNGRVTLNYKDSTHRYSAIVDGEKKRPSSVTTIKGQTLEKNGLMTWAMGLAIRDLFGFYDFKSEDGNQMTGFSKDVGSMWNTDMSDKEAVLQNCLKASKAWTVKQKAGADIGTLTHDAVEQHLLGTPFKITIDEYRKRVSEKEGEDAITDEWEEKAEEEVQLANAAFSAFKNWWKELGATVVSTEAILYSIQYNLAGTMDYLIEVPGKGLVLGDLKTTKASVPAGAPQGVYYDFFIQLGIYASMLQEMGEKLPDDLCIISARKDGGFDIIYASEVGLSVQDCIEWGAMTIEMYELMKKTKKQLVERAK